MSTFVFGIDLDLIPDNTVNKEDFAKCLFFSQGLTSSDAFFIMQVINKLGEENILKLHEALKAEIEKEAFHRKNLVMEMNWNKSIIEIYSKSKSNIDIIYKLNTWVNYFKKPENLEITEYYNFFSITLKESFMDKEASSGITLKKPADIYSKLKDFVIGQDEAVRSVSFAFYLHLLKTRKITPEIYNITNTSRMQGDITLPDPHIMLIGPTGSGKTHIIKTLCSLFDIPFVKFDCAQLVVSGYVGLQVDQALTMLYMKSKNLEEAQKGVIYFDEFDKIREHEKSKSLGGYSLQYEFLSLFDQEEKMINIDMSKYADRTAFNTKNLMYIFSGSFYGIEKMVEERIRKQSSIGFNSNIKALQSAPEELLKQIIPDDFVSFGIIPELIGRASYYVSLDHLSKEQIIEIIKNTESSYLSGFENFFWIHYDRLVIDEDVYGLIAEKVIEKKLGARTIKPILQALFADALFRSPNTIMETFHITKEDFYKIIGK